MYHASIQRPSNIYHVRRSTADLNGLYRSPSGYYPQGKLCVHTPVSRSSSSLVMMSSPRDENGLAIRAAGRATGYDVPRHARLAAKHAAALLGLVL